MKIAVGLSQLPHRAPVALPTGTRSDAIAPTIVPSANGVRIEDSANARSIRIASRSDRAADRSAYAVPRRMIPTAAMNSGTASVDAIDPNATGYAVQKITSTKISQTWLASHTGPIER